MSRQTDNSNSTAGLVVRLSLAACGMFAFGFALVPLYDIFCEVTGIRIPIAVSEAASITEEPDKSRSITLELLANTNNNAPWEFHPLSDRVEVQTGLMQDTEFYAKNLSGRPINGVATPDIRPVEAGRYFRKVECFCFEEQQFATDEGRNMLVRFYVDPDLPPHIDTITLSYTLFAKEQRVASN